MIMLFDQEYAVEQFGKSQKAEGREEGITDTLVSLVRKGLLTVKDAAEQAGVTEDAFRKLMNGDI